MSGVRFVKGHGTGNDFVVLPDVDAQLELSDAVVAAICDRHFGIGADGILRVVPAAAMGVTGTAQWFMDYRNADGGAVEMCGNGIRVFARYLHEAGLESAESFGIATRDGVKVVTRMAADTYAVEMGTPVVAADVPTTLLVDGTTYDAMQVSIGNPHAVIFVDDVASAPVTTHGPRIETMALFPQGTNVEFVRVEDKTQLTLRVWERGVGETLSCGTGACAAAVASAYDGRSGRRVDVDVPGGRLHVDWTDDGCVTMTGPAVFVASGEIDPGWLAALP